MFLRSSGGGFLSTCGFADASAEVFGAMAGLWPAAGGGLCSTGFFAGSLTVGGLSASLAAGDLFGSVCASRGPAASKPVIKREIGLNIRHGTLKRPHCPIAKSDDVAAGRLTPRTIPVPSPVGQRPLVPLL